MTGLEWPHINFAAVFVVWIVHIIMGLVWFHRRLFGTLWTRLTGRDLEPAAPWIVPGFLGHLAMAFVLAALIELAQAHTAAGGMIIGLMACAGFIIPMEIGELVWERIPFRLFLLRTGNQAAGLAVSGLIYGAWR
jgi:hypothetical protein